MNRSIVCIDKNIDERQLTLLLNELNKRSIPKEQDLMSDPHFMDLVTDLAATLNAIPFSASEELRTTLFRNKMYRDIVNKNFQKKLDDANVPEEVLASLRLFDIQNWYEQHIREMLENKTVMKYFRESERNPEISDVQKMKAMQYASGTGLMPEWVQFMIELETRAPGFVSMLNNLLTQDRKDHDKLNRKFQELSIDSDAGEPTSYAEEYGTHFGMQGELKRQAQRAEIAYQQQYGHASAF